MRQAGIGTRLLAAICDALPARGVRKLRTLLARDNTLILSFFRSQGMMAAPMIPLEMDLPPAAAAGRMKLQVNTMLALYSVMEFAADPERHIRRPRSPRSTACRSHHLAKVLASWRAPAWSSRCAAWAAATASPPTCGA